MHKTKQAALNAARKILGPEALEGLDFALRNTGAGWEHYDIPPANDAAAAAQAARLEPPAKPKKAVKRGFAGKPKDGREEKRLQLIVEADARNAARAAAANARADKDGNPPAHPNPQGTPKLKTPLADRAVAAKISVEKKRAARKAAARSKPPSPDGQTKAEMILGMLSKPAGVTSAEIEKATGWASHSVRGQLGAFRKRGIPVVSKKLKGEPTIYRTLRGTLHPADPKSEDVGDVV